MPGLASSQAKDTSPVQAKSEIEQLFCALMYLLTRQARTPGQTLEPAIRDHLARLMEHPDTRTQPLLQSTCRRLLRHWQTEGGDAAGQTIESMVPGGMVH
jgi:hypothetical protein